MIKDFILQVWGFLSSYIFSVLSIIISLLLGIFFEFIIRKKLEKIALKTKWEGDEIIIKSLKGFLFLTFLVIGIFIALVNLPLKEDIIKTIQKILIIISIVIVTIVVTKISVGFFGLYSSKIKGNVASVSILSNLIKFTLIIIGLIIILNYLGISITPIITALGIGGLAVALALQDTLSNFFAGLQILMAHQIKKGDYIRLENGDEGYVIDITWRNTTIQQLSNNIIVIPNSKLSQTIIINYNLPETDFSIIVPVGVSYDSDLEKVERITIEVARYIMENIDGGVKDFQPVIRFHTFSDFSINFNVILRVKEFSYQYPVRSEFIKMLHKRYKEEEIEIPLPIRKVYIKNFEKNL